MARCPVCQTESDKVLAPERFEGDDYGNIKKVECPRCGNYKMFRSQYFSLLNDNYKDIFRSTLSYWIKNFYSVESGLIISREQVESINEMSLPKVNEQANNLIVWLGNNCNSPEERWEEHTNVIASIIGAKNGEGVQYILEYLRDSGFVIYSGIANNPTLGLTVAGWNRYEELKREGIETRRAFMAMKFGDRELTAIYNDNFKKAVKQTGFDLFKLDDNPKAGLIDDRMRVEIRNSRFLLSDLSHGNAGAYLEAGFAEGLGKPVIYLCRKDVFDNPETKPHFDVNHHQTIVWDPSNINEAEQLLKDTIRATLPLEAKMTDD